MSAAHIAPRHLPSLRTDPESCTSPATEIGNGLDEIIALFRKAMPGSGLKIVVPPPLPDGRVGPLSLSMWRRGERSAPVHAGASAREAVQKLFDSEVPAERGRRTRDACRLCRGIGWYIAGSGARAICSHPLRQVQGEALSPSP